MGFTEELQLAEQNLAAANAYHANAVGSAYAKLQQVEEGYWIRNRAIESQIADTKRAYEQGLSSYENITLFPSYVFQDGVTILLKRGTTALVETSGNVDYGRDRRALSLTIDSPDGTRITTMGSPKKEGEAREFAALVMNTAAKIDGEPPTLKSELARLEQELAAARADTRELDAARAAYSAAYYDTSAIVAAQQALDALKARIPQEQLATYENEKSSKLHRHRIIAVAVIAGVVLLALLILGFAALVFAFSR